MLPYRCVSPQCAMPLCQSYTRFDACPVSCLRCMSPCSTLVLLLSLLSPGSRPVSAGSLCCKLVLALPDFKPTQARAGSTACRGFRQFRYGNPLVSSQVAGGTGRRENAANLRCPGLPGQWQPCVRVGSQRNAIQHGKTGDPLAAHSLQVAHKACNLAAAPRSLPRTTASAGRRT